MSIQQKRKKGNVAAVLILLLLSAIVFGFKQCRKSKQNYPDREISTTGGDWRHHKLIYTKHARCRMDCREITEEEVEYILENGTVNPEKSREADEEVEGHCPTYALEGNTKDGQHIRVVYAGCEKITKVVTAIDLAEDHPCNCR